MNRRAPAIAAVVGVAVLALVVVLVISPSERQQSDPGRELIGNVAPALTGTTLTGDRFDIDEHRGQWVLVNFFATWCPPCVEEHPELVAFSERNRGEVQVVSVAYDSHELDRVRKFFAEKGGDWPVITGGADGATIEYRVKGVPESFLVDPSGTVVTKYNGGVTAEELERSRTGLLSSVVMRGESSGATAGRLASDAYYVGRARTLAEVSDKIESANLEQVNEYLAAHPVPTPTIVTLGRLPEGGLGLPEAATSDVATEGRA